MTQAATFLASLGRALSTAALYREGHPTFQRAMDAAWEDLQQLVGTGGRPATFTFIGETVLFGDLPLDDRRRFEWSERLAETGVQRVQFEAALTRDEFEGFIGEMCDRLGGGQGWRSAAARPLPTTSIRYGGVGLRSEAGAGDESLKTATLGFGLDAEIDAVSWVHQEVTDSHPIPLVEVEAIVGSLSVAMHSSSQMVLPLVTLKEFDQYTTTHSLNVSVLAMGLAERFGLNPSDVRSIGVAGLLHDIGKTVVPREILSKPGRLTQAELREMNRHPEDGARLILKADQDLGLAAIVAYEHHIRIDGGGYPTVTHARTCHPASRLVHVCDVFDALRTHRPYRAAWSFGDTERHLRERSGLEFDPRMVEPFLAMIGACGQPAL
jgi:putative nucleotidyltransferase with HDIG domain